MRRYPFFILTLFFAFSIFPNSISPPDTLLKNRADLAEFYHSINDSLLLMSDNKKQEFDSLINALIETDNIIINHYLNEIIRNNALLKEQISELQNNISENNDKLAFYEKLKLPVLLVIAALLVLFLLFLTLFTVKTISLKKIRFEIEKYESSYEETQSLIEKFTKENSELKSKDIRLQKNLEKLNQESEAKIKLLKTDIDNALNENKLIQKRLAELTESIDREKQTRKLALDENLQLKEKNFALEQKLNDINKLYEKEIDTRKHIEEELKQLLDQLKRL